MAKVEIEESDLKTLANARKLVDDLYNDGKLGMKFKKLLKEKDPSFNIPEIDAAAPHVERLDKMEQTITDLRQQLTNERQDSDLSRSFAAVRREFNLTEEGMDLVKKTMLERKNPDARAVAALLLHEQPPAPVTPNGIGTRVGFFDHSTEDEKNELQQIVSDPDGWFDRTAAKVIAEERNRARGLPVGMMN